MDKNATTQPAVTGRLDIYRDIHIALRAYMGDTLGRVTRLDQNDTAEVSAVLAQVRELMDFCAGHLEHENHFVHTAIEARRTGASSATAADHREHEEAIAELRAMVTAAETAHGAARAEALEQLRRRLGVFVGENFVHMNVEETANNAALWAAYSDAELAALHQSIVASLPPSETAVVMRWLLPAISPAERVALLADMRDHAPAPVFEGVLAIARAHLSAHDWHKLDQALAPQVRLAA
ncbi:MAG: hemerythrin domain-containing protein [Betaproteobacteria bacterium]